VVPTVAKATVNFRILPGTTTDEIVESVKKIMNDDRIVITKQATIAEPSEVTPITSTAYQSVESAIKNAYPEIITSPFLVIGATDSRHFREVSQNIIKFSPMIDPIGFHGIDERVSLESYQTAMWFFEQLMRNTK
jgi:carboxypeptidase PM20D1